MQLRASLVLVSLLALYLVDTEDLRSEEPYRDITISLNGKELKEGESLEFPDPPLDPGVNMLSTSYNIDDGQPDSDTSTRNYNIICSERHAQKLKEPKRYVEFTFDLNADEKPESTFARTSFAHRVGWTLRRTTKFRPAGSKQIGEKVIDALGEARDRDQIRGFNIDLEIEKGFVILSGDVPSKEQRALVAKIVRKVPEVLQVDNQLVVKEAK